MTIQALTMRARPARRSRPLWLLGPSPSRPAPYAAHRQPRVPGGSAATQSRMRRRSTRASDTSALRPSGIWRASSTGRSSRITTWPVCNSWPRQYPWSLSGTCRSWRSGIPGPWRRCVGQLWRRCSSRPYSARAFPAARPIRRISRASARPYIWPSMGADPHPADLVVEYPRGAGGSSRTTRPSPPSRVLMGIRHQHLLWREAHSAAR